MFAAEVIGADRFATTLRVELVWKGDAGRIVSMATRTFRDADGTLRMDSCDSNLRTGERYLVFAVRDGSRRLLIQICGPTAPRSRTSGVEALLDRIAPSREPAAAPNDLERILADLDRDLAPIAASRVRAEEALRSRARTPQTDAAFLALRLELKDIIGTLARTFQTREFQMLVGPAGAIA